MRFDQKMMMFHLEVSGRQKMKDLLKDFGRKEPVDLAHCNHQEDGSTMTGCGRKRLRNQRRMWINRMAA